MDAKFDLEKKYQEYLELSFKGAMLSEVQNTELKRAFMTGCASTLAIMKDDVGRIENEDEAVMTLQGMMDQAKLFFVNEVNKQN